MPFRRKKEGSASPFIGASFKVAKAFNPRAKHLKVTNGAYGAYSAYKAVKAGKLSLAKRTALKKAQRASARARKSMRGVFY